MSAGEIQKKICIVAYTDLSKDPRPNRQIILLKDSFHITSIGVSPAGYEKKFYALKKHSFLINFLRIALFLKFKFYEKYYWDKYKLNLLKTLKDANFDLIVVHEIRLLPFALKFSKNAKIILDAHEYSPENFSDNFLWRFFIQDYYKYLCTKYIRETDIVTTVSENFARLYSQNFKVSSTVITSAAEYTKLTPKEVDSKHVKLIHHGNCSPSRNLEIMIDAAAHFNSEFHLYLMLVVSTSSLFYFKKLKYLARNLKNVHFLPPINRSELIKHCNNFDVSVNVFPPVNTNLQYVLPNKFFESIQSRLMLVIGPSVEMSYYVNKYNIGKITNDFSSMSLANTINNLTADQIMYYKQQCNHYSRELSAEIENQKFSDVVNNLLST